MTGGTGTFGDVEAALQWVVDNAEAYSIASVNLSLGDSGNHTIEQGLYGIDDELAVREGAADDIGAGLRDGHGAAVDDDTVGCGGGRVGEGNLDLTCLVPAVVAGRAVARRECGAGDLVSGEGRVGERREEQRQRQGGRCDQMTGRHHGWFLLGSRSAV